MITNDTRFDVLLYIYDELSPSQKQDMDDKMSWDFDLRDEMLAMKEVKNTMERCLTMLSPSNAIVASLIKRINA